MQKLSKEEMRGNAQKVLDANPEFKEVFSCEDGNVFEREMHAKPHCNAAKIEYKRFVPKEEVSEKTKAPEMTIEEAEAFLNATSVEDIETSTVPSLLKVMNVLKLKVAEGEKGKTAIIASLLAQKELLLNSNS